jgi:tetraacyldisaccharide-1-P 4'-kinase
LGQLAHQKQATGLFTTQKDLVKIPRTDIAGVPLWAVEIGVEWLSGEDFLLSRLQELFNSPSPGRHVDGSGGSP